MDASIQRSANTAVMSACALPQIAKTVPKKFTVPGVDGMAGPLAIALLELGMITDADLRPCTDTTFKMPAIPHEKDLVEMALSRWWSSKTQALRIFQWSLHVQAITTYNDEPFVPWFCVSVNGYIPQRTLALRAGQLNREHPLFAQTVIAVLDDAFRYLPEAFTPSNILGMAQYHYWDGNTNEEGWIKDQLAFGDYATREDLLKEVDVFKHSDLFAVMPEWLPRAKRGCGRAQLARAARTPLSKNVIAACDDIMQLVHSEHFILDPYDVGTHKLQLDTVEACIILRWNEKDACLRVIDDAINDRLQCGEYCEFISAEPVDVSTEAVKFHLQKTENMLEMAAAVERLLDLISQPIKETQ